MAEINLFEPRRLLRVVQLPGYRAHSYLRDTFFSQVRTFDTETIDIDIVKNGHRKVAQFVHRALRGSYVGHDGYVTQTFRPAYVAPYTVTDAEQVLKRLPGEALYNPISPSERAAQILAKDMIELDRRITRREELMAAEAIFQGKITIKGEGLGDGQQVTFWDDSDRPYTELATPWTDTKANPLNDLRLICQDVARRTGRTPTTLLCGAKAVNALLDRLKGDDSAINSRRVMLGQIDPQTIGDGVTYVGDLRYPALSIVTYDEYYDDDTTGECLPMVPEDCVLIACRGAETTRAYGQVAVTTPQGIYFATGDRVPNSWISMDNPVGRVLQISCAPLMVIHEPQAFHVVKVVDDDSSQDGDGTESSGEQS